jgi:hypothetical protein
MERSGSMISSSTKEPLIKGKGKDQKMISAVEISEPFVRETAKYLLQKFGIFDKIHQSEELEFTLNTRTTNRVLDRNSSTSKCYLVEDISDSDEKEISDKALVSLQDYFG